MRGHAQEHPQAVKHLAPDFFRDFVCAASACPDSCCRAGWEIVIDPDTLNRYEALPGPDGNRVRAAVTPEEEPLLRQDENRVCVLLDPDGLCHAQKVFGHEALCRVCREYPRFHREFGNRTEHGVSLSCPTAFRLATERPFGWTEWEDQAPIVPNDLDPERYLLLRQGRELALKLLGEEHRPPEDRIALVLDLARRLQAGLDGRKRAGQTACRRLSGPIGQLAALRRRNRRHLRADKQGLSLQWNPAGICRRDPGQRISDLAEAFSGLEILSPEWQEGLKVLTSRLREADGQWPPLQRCSGAEDAEVCLRYLRCSLYKYWLDALDDGRLLARVRRSLAMTELGRAMDLLVPKDRSWLQRISREIEHCEENLARLLDLQE